jgi:3-deoxy-D-manno-octulosonic-acid transferase
MMNFLYRIFLVLSQYSLLVARPFSPKIAAFLNGRKNLFLQLKNSFKENQNPVFWIHCASLGEFEQGRPLIEKFRKQYRDYKILLTFFSPSGYDVRKNYEHADFIFYLPLDTQKNAEQFIKIVKPTRVVFVKYEFWHHYISQLKRKNIPIISISAIFRKNQTFFKPLGSFFRNILFNFTYIFVQNDESVRLLKSIGITNCAKAGDTRFDRVFEVVQHAVELPIAKAFKGDQKVVVVGSCWEEDLDVLNPFINESQYQLKFIIAPHEITEDFIAEIKGAIQGNSIRYSQATGNLEDYQVLIVDNIGLLSRLYRYGEFAFVGGAYGKGLHNILEAACYGIPILFGNKNYEKYEEAVTLMNYGGAFAIVDYPDLKAKYALLNVPETFLLACEVTNLYVKENLGATDKIMKHIQNLIA